MLLTRRFFPTFLISLLLFGGVAQAQNSPGGTNPQNCELKFDGGKDLQPWQPCLNADQGQEEVKGFLQEKSPQSSKTVNVPLTNQPNPQDKTKKVAGAEKPKPDSLRPSFGKNRGSSTQNMGQKVSKLGGLPTTSATLSSGLGASFLDGYLLKSLEDKGSRRRRKTKEQESKEKEIKKAY
jgi:hypothetical protein